MATLRSAGVAAALAPPLPAALGAAILVLAISLCTSLCASLWARISLWGPGLLGSSASSSEIAEACPGTA